MLSYIYNKKQGLKMAFEIDFYEKEYSKSVREKVQDDIQQIKNGDFLTKIDKYFESLMLPSHILLRLSSLRSPFITRLILSIVWAGLR